MNKGSYEENTMRRIRRFTALLVLLPLTCLPLMAENLRGKIAGTVIPDGDSVRFHPEELVVISTEGIKDFQDGWELEFTIPDGLRQYPNSFALLIYRNVTPPPSQENLSYQATRSFMRLLPSRESFYIKVPLAGGSSLAKDALTDVIPLPVSTEDLPLMATVLPVSKGIPDSVFDFELNLKASTIWRQEGTLSVNLTNPSNDPDERIQLEVNGKKVDLNSPLPLPAGLHRIRVESNLAPTQDMTVAVEPGEQKTVSVTLDYRLPELQFEIPPGSILLLDGEEIENQNGMATIQVSPGNHVLSYLIGDTAVERSIDVLPGGKISIRLIMDIAVTDNTEGPGSPYGAGDG